MTLISVGIMKRGALVLLWTACSLKLLLHMFLVFGPNVDLTTDDFIMLSTNSGVTNLHESTTKTPSSNSTITSTKRSQEYSHHYDHRTNGIDLIVSSDDEGDELSVGHVDADKSYDDSGLATERPTTSRRSTTADSNSKMDITVVGSTANLYHDGQNHHGSKISSSSSSSKMMGLISSMTKLGGRTSLGEAVRKGRNLFGIAHGSSSISNIRMKTTTNREEQYPRAEVASVDDVDHDVSNHDWIVMKDYPHDPQHGDQDDQHSDAVQMVAKSQEFSLAIFSILTFTAPSSKLRRTSLSVTAKEMKALALKSWLHVSPQVHIFLIASPTRVTSTYSESMNAAALASTVAQLKSWVLEEMLDHDESLASRVHIEASEVDFNLEGTPLVNSILARAQAHPSDLAMFVEPGTVLFPDILRAAEKLCGRFDSWMLTSAPLQVNKTVMRSLEHQLKGELWGGDGGGTKARERKKNGSLARIMEEVRGKGLLDSRGEVAFFLWNNVGAPLVGIGVPPFFAERGWYMKWILEEALKTKSRFVIDGSDVVTAVAMQFAHEAGIGELADKSVDSEIRQENDGVKDGKEWEFAANFHLARTQGKFTGLRAGPVWTTWKLAACDEEAAQGMCLLKRLRPGNCTCEHSAYSSASTSDPVLSGPVWVCGHTKAIGLLDNGEHDGGGRGGGEGGDGMREEGKKDGKEGRAGERGSGKTKGQLRGPELGELLQRVKDKDNVVVLVAVTAGYAPMTMSFVCMLRSFGINNFLVAALDEEMYEYGLTQGLPVFYEESAEMLRTMAGEPCTFGSLCFRQFTKLKSRAVLRVLKEGVNVLWTDVDIVWFQNPLPHLLSFGPGTFPVQSNEPDHTKPANGVRRINSGFYFARADEVTVKAFEAIVSHAARTRLSEQPSFYDVLCGEDHQLTVGLNECKWTNGLRTIFLSRERYPNGAVYNLWKEKNVTHACGKRGCAILHNNWIAGKEAKMKRMVENGFWYFDVENRICIRPWHRRLQSLGASSYVLRK